LNSKHGSVMLSMLRRAEWQKRFVSILFSLQHLVSIVTKEPTLDNLYFMPTLFCFFCYFGVIYLYCCHGVAYVLTILFVLFMFCNNKRYEIVLLFKKGEIADKNCARFQCFTPKCQSFLQKSNLDLIDSKHRIFKFSYMGYIRLHGANCLVPWVTYRRILLFEAIILLVNFVFIRKKFNVCLKYIHFHDVSECFHSFIYYRGPKSQG